jgi:SAM-dependent methyltransferase
MATTEEFVGKVFTDTVGLTTTVLAMIGDRLDLFKILAAHGPQTSAELAARANISERYGREWLGGMTSAGYLSYEPATGCFALPAEHVPVLAEEGGPVFLSGVHQELLGTITIVPQLIDSFRTGGGVAAIQYDANLWEGIDRFTASWHKNLLIPVWIEAVPDVKAKLEQGASVADVGCGFGRALIALAQAFPNSRFVGFDSLASAIARANENAIAAGVADRVRFEQRDAANGLPEQYDLITTFDVVHDAVDPAGMLRAIRHALKPDGAYLCLEINCSDKLEENAGPAGTLFHGFSVLLCMTTSLAEGGAGLGTVGLSEPVLRRMAEEAGFREVRRLPIDNPFNILYEVRA